MLQQGKLNDGTQNFKKIFLIDLNLIINEMGNLHRFIRIGPAVFIFKNSKSTVKSFLINI